MKKSTLLILGLIALMVAAGLALASCSDDDGDCCSETTFTGGGDLPECCEKVMDKLAGKAGINENDNEAQAMGKLIAYLTPLSEAKRKSELDCCSDVILALVDL